MIRRASCLLSALVLVIAGGVALALPGAAAATPVLGTKVIGHSVRHRPIVAYHLGDPRLRTSSLILGQMHGDEHAGVTLAKSIIHGTQSVEGVNLWVIPTMNPDGEAAHTRQNAHGVDLNRNWPDHWRHLTGQYYSGTKPLSEPESRAVWRFLRAVRPRYAVSLHQPLDGVDTTDGGGAAYRRFRLALAHNLDLPTKAFRCWSTCYGSMSGWYHARGFGVAIETVEFGWHPTHHYLMGKARRGIVAALHGRFGSLARHDPRTRVAMAAKGGRVYFTGWAYDIDAPYALCLSATNLRAGAHDTRTCATLTVPA